MKKIKKNLQILYFLLICVSCKTNVTKRIIYLNNLKNSNHIISPTFLYSYQMDWENVPLTSKINQIVLHYFQDFEKIIFATQANKNSHEFSMKSEKENENPIRESLRAIDIEDSLGNKISFFSLKKEDQNLFLNNWILFQADQLSKKIKFAPFLEKYIYIEDIAIKKTLKTQTYTDRYGEIKVKSNHAFFNILGKEMKNRKLQYNNLEKTYNAEKLNKVDISKTTSILIENGERGNLLVRLAMNNSPFCWINVKNGNVGHVAILTKKIPKDVIPTDNICIAANRYDSKGNNRKEVRYEELQEWCTSSYIMELGYVKFKWKGGKLEKIFTPISNQAIIADEAEKYLGVRYASKIEFPFAKSIVPYSFTCATLAWYCCSKIYGFDISHNHWWQVNSLVSPEAIYRSIYTRTKAKIEN